MSPPSVPSISASRAERLGENIGQWSEARFNRFCLGILATALAVYLALNQFYLGATLSPWPGSAGYGRIAQFIVETGLYSENGATFSVNRPPLYPVFLAVCRLVGGSAANGIAYAIQAGVFVALGYYLVRLCRRIGGNRIAALVCCGLYATHIEFGMECLQQRETLFYTAAFALLIGRLASSTKLDAWRATKIGAAGALLYLLRPTGVVIPVVLPGLILLGMRAWQPLRWLRLSGIGIGAFALFTLPWHLAVWLHTHDLSLLPTSTSGENLYKGHFENFEVVAPWIDLDDYNPWVNELAAGLDESGRNQLLKTRGWEAIFADPLRAVKRGFYKLGALYSPLRTPLGEGELVDQGHGLELRNFHLNRLHFFMLPHALVMIWGTVLFVAHWRRHSCEQKRLAWQIGLILAAVTAVHMLTFGETRHRLPLDICFILATSLSVAGLMSARIAKTA